MSYLSYILWLIKLLQTENWEQNIFIKYPLRKWGHSGIQWKVRLFKVQSAMNGKLTVIIRTTFELLNWSQLCHHEDIPYPCRMKSNSVSWRNPLDFYFRTPSTQRMNTWMKTGKCGRHAIYHDMSSLGK